MKILSRSQIREIFRTAPRWKLVLAGMGMLLCLRHPISMGSNIVGSLLTYEETKAKYSNAHLPELSDEQVKIIFNSENYDCMERVENTFSYKSIKNQLNNQFEEEGWPQAFIESGAPMGDVVHAAELINEGTSENDVLSEMEQYVQITEEFYDVPDYYPAFIVGAASGYLPKYLQLIKAECKDLAKN